MLSINPINFLSVKAKNNTKQNNNLYQFPRFNGFKNFNNLAPLKADTISFSGARNLNRGLLEAFDNQEQCQYVSENAAVAEKNLKRVLTKQLSGNVATKNKPNGLIEPIIVRTKDPESIREKIASKLEESIIKHNTDGFINPNKVEEIKETITDIVGARIVLRQGDVKKNSKIAHGLTKLVNSGDLNITSIEVILPKGHKSDPYFSNEDIEKLKDAVNKKREEQHLNKIKIKTRPSESGYCAIHLDVDLSNDRMQAKNAGYKGEIQIIGRDVAEFKEIEDLCYKIAQHKDIKRGHQAYLPFADFLDTKLQSPELREAFSKYTYKAYIIQKDKEAKDDKYDITHLPSLEECGMQNILPPELDFNHLAKIKACCDRIYETSKEDINVQSNLSTIRLLTNQLNNIYGTIELKNQLTLKRAYDELYNLTKESEIPVIDITQEQINK